MATRHIRLGAEQWRQLINEQSLSDLSVEQFCRQQGVGFSTFQKWRRRFKEIPLSSSEQSLSSFVEVVPLQENQPGILLKISESLCIEFPINVSANTVADMIHALSTRSGR